MLGLLNKSCFSEEDLSFLWGGVPFAGLLDSHLSVGIFRPRREADMNRRFRFLCLASCLPADKGAGEEGAVETQACRNAGASGGVVGCVCWCQSGGASCGAV